MKISRMLQEKTDGIEEDVWRSLNPIEELVEEENALLEALLEENQKDLKN